MKYLRTYYKEHYYEKAVPKKLQLAVGKTQIKEKLGLSVGTSSSVVAAKIAEIDERYTAWFNTLSEQNHVLLNEIEKRKAAIAYLNAHGHSVGSLSPLSIGTLSEQEAHKDHVSHSMEEDFYELNEIGYKIENKQQLSAAEQVIEYAWHLATEPRKLVVPATFEDAWKYFSQVRQLDWSIRSQRKSIQFWERFISVVGNQTLTSDNIYDAQRNYAESQLKKNVQPQSIERSLTPILSAFRMYCEEEQLNISVNRYRIKQKKVVTERKGINTDDLQSLWRILLKGQNMKQDVQLALLIMAQSSVINSELQRVKRSSLVVAGDPEYKGITWLKIEEGKTRDRVRPVPLVAATELIHELTQKVSDDTYLLPRLQELTESSMSAQLNKVIKQVNPELTSYSLRHGWLDRSFNADAPESFQDRVGGWSSGSKSKKRGYARLADTNIDRLKTYEEWQRKVNKEILPTKLGNIVHLNMAR